MKLIIENWKRFINENISQQTMFEITQYLYDVGLELDDVSIGSEVMRSKEDKEFWLKSKLDFEGDPHDEKLIDQICKDGVIKEPIIIDLDQEYTIEGRHRLAAALRCNIDMPVVFIERV